MMQRLRDRISVRFDLIHKYGLEKASILELFIDAQDYVNENKFNEFKGKFWFPYEQKILSKKLAFHSSTALNQIKSLQKSGVILVRKEASSDRRNLYRIVEEKLYGEVDNYKCCCGEEVRSRRSISPQRSSEITGLA